MSCPALAAPLRRRVVAIFPRLPGCLMALSVLGRRRYTLQGLGAKNVPGGYQRFNNMYMYIRYIPTLNRSHGKHHVDCILKTTQLLLHKISFTSDTVSAKCWACWRQFLGPLPKARKATRLWSPTPGFCLARRRLNRLRISQNSIKWKPQHCADAVPRGLQLTHGIN